MGRLLRGLLLAVLLLSGAPLAGPGGGPVLAATSGGVLSFDPDAVRDGRDAVLDSRYQTELPEPQQLPEIERFEVPDWLPKMLFWVMVAVIVGLVLFFLSSLLSDLLLNRDSFQASREHKAAGPARVETPRAEHRKADPHTLAEADRLAGEGRFSEAIHLLLLVAMDRLHRELGPRVAPAMTSREVLRLPALPGDTVEPLTRMVQASEINHFGGRSAAEPDYHSCRADFLRFNGEAA